MTDQKTPLKTKAKTVIELIAKTPYPHGFERNKYVLLSDVEPLEAEIEQLKKELQDEKYFHKADEQQAEYYQKQIETIKQTFPPYKDVPIPTTHVALTKWIVEHDYQVKKWYEKVFWEKTEPTKPENCNCELCIISARITHKEKTEI